MSPYIVLESRIYKSVDFRNFRHSKQMQNFRSLPAILYIDLSFVDLFITHSLEILHTA